MKKKASTKILAVLMALLMLAALLPPTARAAGTPYTGQPGEGSYTISDAGQLALLAAAVNGGTCYQNCIFTLTSDIDLAPVCGPVLGSWTPIGIEYDATGRGGFDPFYVFMGTFDGGGHTISNLYYNDSATDNVGLFGYTQAAVIKNIRMTGVDITGGTSVGGVVGCARSNTEISACHVSGSLAGNQSIGGIAGVLFGATATNCYTAVAITLGSNCAGGIAGVLLESSGVSNCYAVGSIASAGGSYVGGIAGEIHTIIYPGGTVSNSVALLEAVSGVSNVGRVVGAKDVPYAVSGCRAWDGMTVNGSPVSASGAADINGADLTATAALAGNTYAAIGWPVYNALNAPYGWVFANGMLPYIQPFGVSEAATYAYLGVSGGTDETPPELSGGSAAAGATFAALHFYSSETGELFCLTRTEAESPPDTAAIKLDGISGTALSAAVNSVTVTGLTASTAYTAYIVVEDLAGNGSEILQIPFTTGESDDTAVPLVVNGVYHIGSAGQLVWFRDLVNGALTDGTPQNKAAPAVLTADIDLSAVCGDVLGSWTPIGNAIGAYTGTFDGAGHTVSNLYIDASAGYQALFGNLNSGTVKNLTVSGAVTSSGNNIGGLAGYAQGSVFTDCRNEAAVSGGGASESIGGLAGYAGGTVFTGCRNEASVGEGRKYIGGVAGFASGYVRFEACVNGGDVSGRSDIGGIAGLAPLSVFDYCVNTGTVTAQTSNAGGLAGSGLTFVGCKNAGIVTGLVIKVGGIVGETGESCALTGCENIAPVTGSGMVGGLAGLLLDGFSISGCANSADINGLYAGTSDSGRVGGLFGYVRMDYGSAASSVTGSYNTGGVTDLSGPDALGGVGGIGGAAVCTGNLLTIKNCYSAGAVAGVNNVGGLLGSVTAKDSGTVSVTNCYSASSAVTDTSGSGATLGGAVGQTALTGSASAGAVSFSNLFYMEGGIGNGIGDDAANADACTVGVKSGAFMKTAAFAAQLGGAFTLYADGIAEITGEPPVNTAARFSAYEYPILRSWLELGATETVNVQFAGAAYTDVVIDGIATYATAVTPGQSITFTVESKYPEVTLVSVSADGNALTPDDGHYTLSGVTADIVVAVVTSGLPETGGQPDDDDVYDIIFTTTPAGASVTVTSDEGDITPADGVYKLKAGRYGYTVSADGYVSKSGSFDVTGSRDIAVTLTEEGAIYTVTIDSSVPVNILSNGLEVASIPGGQVPTALDFGAGTYTYETDGWGGGGFTVEGDRSVSLRKADFSAQIQNDNNVLYTMSVVDGNGVVYTPGGMTLADGAARARFLLPAQKGKVAYTYTLNVPSNYWASSGEAYIYSDTGFFGLNLSDNQKFKIAPKIALSVTVPEGAELIVYQRPQFYRPFCLLSGTSGTNGNGTETYTYDAPADTTLMYELKLDGYVKKSDVLETDIGNTSFTVPLSSFAPLSAWSGDVKDASQRYYEANLLMNVADSKYLELPEGGEYELFLFRAWQAIDTTTSNAYVDPDYHYEVIYGDSVEITDPYYAGATIKAVSGKTGLSVVRITYDALDHCGKVYSRLWTENTGIIVVNVGADASNTTIDPGITLSDNDTAYYTRSVNGVTVDANKQYAEYTFTPTAESAGQSVPVASVRVHEPLGDTDWAQNNWNDNNYWTSCTANSDGSYTVQLTDGRNVIEIRAGDAVTYYTVSTYGTDITISGAQVTKSLSGRLNAQIETGAQTEISFEELRMPIAKLGAICNPGFPDQSYLVYTLDGGTANGIESEHTQYDIRLNNIITLTAFSEPGQYSLTEGKVHTTAITSGGFTYRDITKGSSSNSEYVPGQNSEENVNGFFSILPDIEFTVVEAKTDAEIVMELIDAIGTVTKDSADVINAARDAYNALNAGEQAQVTNYNVLLAAEEAFERILEESGPTPVFTWNITGKTATYKVNETAAALQVAVSVADQGTLTYQWYVKTEGGEFAPVAGAVTNSYTPPTQNEGTYYYKVIVTNTYDGAVYTVESGVASVTVEPKAFGKDITHTTSYYPTSGLSFNMNGKSIAGYVTVSFVDYGIRTSSKVDFATPLGVLILPTQVPYAAGDTIATVTLRLLDALDIDYSHKGSTTSGFYLASIENFYVSDGTLVDSFGEFDAGGGSGWMVTWNNWFINMGASEFQADDGDIIKWQYTCQLGNDIGSSMDNPSAEITGINFASNYGKLSPSFSTSTANYTYTIPASVTSISMEATQANYWAQLIYTSGGKTYKPLQAIPVSDGTVITLDCNYYNDYTQKEASLQDSDKVTITIKVANENDASITPSVTASGGTASVSITSTQMTEAINKVKKSGGDIFISPVITGAADTVRVELPKASVSAVAAQTQADLVISTPVGSMTIPNGALASIASQASGGTVEISLGTVDTSKLTPAQKKAVGNHTVYDLSITSGGQSITSFDGASLTLSLPYTLGEGENPSDVKVWYLNDAGELIQINGTYNASTGLVSFSTDHLSYYVVGYSETDKWNNPFKDVSEDDWYYEAVEFAVTNGLFTGTSDTTFSPDMPMTRAMLVTVLYRLEGDPAVTGINSFTDAADGQWYTNAVLWASGNSIVAGYGDGRFGINDKVTREQLATILYRYAKYKGYDVSASASLSGYADAGNIRDWASRAIKWAVAEGLITGVTSAALDPSGSATRAQVATIFMRFVENIAE